jgi:hypothetical protein
VSDLTSELNLALAVDDDDLADYLVLAAGLRGTLTTLDGLFNSTTGHNHGGAHQGGDIDPSQFPDNTINGSKLIDLSVYGTKIAPATITADKLVAAIIEGIFAGTVANPSANYVVATGVMYVFAQAAITVTLPAAASTNRPIEVWALSGTVTVSASGGTVYGGSINLSTGAVTNGSITTGDAITYKSDNTNWRAG